MEGQETVMPMVKGTPTRSILPQARSHFSPAGILASWMFDDVLAACLAANKCCKKHEESILRRPMSHEKWSCKHLLTIKAMRSFLFWHMFRYKPSQSLICRKEVFRGKFGFRFKAYSHKVSNYFPPSQTTNELSGEMAMYVWNIKIWNQLEPCDWMYTYIYIHCCCMYIHLLRFDKIIMKKPKVVDSNSKPVEIAIFIHHVQV